MTLRGPAIAASVLCVAAFDLVFVPPRGRFTVDDVQYLLTFAIMLAVALIIARLVESVRRQAASRRRSRSRPRRSASAARCLRRSRTTCARRSLSWPAHRRVSPSAASGWSAGERRALANSIFEQAREMSEHVAKILQMTRLDAGAVNVDRDWSAMSEIVGSVLARLA